jgi:hypothetical protein
MYDATIIRPDIYTTARLGKQQVAGLPAFQFSVLTCQKPLLATKTICANGKEVPFDKPKFFYYRYCEIELLEDFAKVVLEWLSDKSRMFIIGGQLLPGLNPKQRHYRRILSRRGAPATIECPPRRWIPLDLDGVEVPNGYGAPDKLAEAAYFIRDNMLPSYFRGVRCVAVATASTGRIGPNLARLRLFFVLTRPADNDALYYWAEGLSIARPDLRLDPTVLRAMQPIYTARPIFRGMTDPVPAWGRVTILDGYTDEVELELPRVRERKKKPKAWSVICNDMPEWMVSLAEGDTGLGVHPEEAAPENGSERAWLAIRRIFNMLDGCGIAPKINLQGRHKTLTKAAWELANLVREGELSEQLAREAFLEAVKGIYNGDEKYSADNLECRINDAFRDVGGRM